MNSNRRLIALCDFLNASDSTPNRQKRSFKNVGKVQLNQRFRNPGQLHALDASGSKACLDHVVYIVAPKNYSHKFA